LSPLLALCFQLLGTIRLASTPLFFALREQFNLSDGFLAKMLSATPVIFFSIDGQIHVELEEPLKMVN